MNVLVLGAGTVGRSVAEILCDRGVNVCVVDCNAAHLQRIEELLDVRTLCGSASDAIVLFQAGAAASDLCLAVTGNDEINLLAASVAKTMGAGRTVARVFSPDFLDDSTFDYQRHLNLDRLLSLERLTAIELARHIRSSTAIAVESFVRGGIEVVGITVGPGAKGAGVPLRDLSLPKDVRVGVISSASGTIIPGPDDAAAPGDQIALIGTREGLDATRTLFEQKPPTRLDVVIAGGGETGYHLARLLPELRCRTTILESDPARCDFLAEHLPKSTILVADVRRTADMQEARVGNADVFVAATGHDEENIVCGVKAKEMGCGRLLTIVRSPDYAHVLERLGIDVAVSPREAMARQVAGMVSDGPVRDRCEVAAGKAEVWEVEVRSSAKACGHTLRNLDLSSHALVAAIDRDRHVRPATADTELKSGDTLVLLVNIASQQHVRSLFD